MEVCITTLSGESYQLQADPTWASRDLKMAVKTASGWDCQLLVYTM